MDTKKLYTLGLIIFSLF